MTEPTGRELDAAIAELLGWTDMQFHPLIDVDVSADTKEILAHEVKEPGEPSVGIVPAYSSDPAAAMELLEIMRKRWLSQDDTETQYWEITDCCEYGWRVAVCWGHHDGSITIVKAKGDLVAAIALAAYRALKVKQAQEG